jgi:hypothetical protein
MAALRVVVPCGLLVYRRFVGACYLHHQGGVCVVACPWQSQELLWTVNSFYISELLRTATLSNLTFLA